MHTLDHETLPAPHHCQKDENFPEVENKMGPIIPALVSQFRPTLLETNPNIRKGDTTEKRKRAMPKKKFRPATPRATMTCPPLQQAPPKPTNSISSAPLIVREDTPWPSAGKMSGHLLKKENWLLPKDYLVTEDKTEDTTIAKPPLERRLQDGRTSLQPEGRKMWLGI